VLELVSQEPVAERRVIGVGVDPGVGRVDLFQVTDKREDHSGCVAEAKYTAARRKISFPISNRHSSRRSATSSECSVLVLLMKDCLSWRFLALDEVPPKMAATDRREWPGASCRSGLVSPGGSRTHANPSPPRERNSRIDRQRNTPRPHPGTSAPGVPEVRPQGRWKLKRAGEPEANASEPMSQKCPRLPESRHDKGPPTSVSAGRRPLSVGMTGFEPAAGDVPCRRRSKSPPPFASSWVVAPNHSLVQITRSQNNQGFVVGCPTPKEAVRGHNLITPPAQAVAEMLVNVRAARAYL